MENLRWYAKKELYYLYPEKYRTLFTDRECVYYMPIIQDGIMHYEKKTFSYNSLWDVETFVSNFLFEVNRSLNTSIFKLSDVKFSTTLKNILNDEIIYEHSIKH